MKKHHSSQISTHLVKTLFVFIALSILSACTTLTDVPSNAPLKLSSVKDLQEWQARGKVLLKHSDEKVSGYFFWHQNNESFTLSLNSFIGTNVLTLTFQDKLATLKVDGKTYKGVDPERLIYHVTGNKIPVNTMSNWMLANVSKKSKFVSQIKYLSNANVEDTSKPNIKSFVYNKAQNQTWLVTYNSYKPKDTLMLPNTLNVQTSAHKIKLTINDWEFIR